MKDDISCEGREKHFAFKPSATKENIEILVSRGLDKKSAIALLRSFDFTRKERNEVNCAIEWISGFRMNRMEKEPFIGSVSARALDKFLWD